MVAKPINVVPHKVLMVVNTTKTKNILEKRIITVQKS